MGLIVFTIWSLWQYLSRWLRTLFYFERFSHTDDLFFTGSAPYLIILSFIFCISEWFFVCLEAAQQLILWLATTFKFDALWKRRKWGSWNTVYLSHSLFLSLPFCVVKDSLKDRYLLYILSSTCTYDILLLFYQLVCPPIFCSNDYFSHIYHQSYKPFFCIFSSQTVVQSPLLRANFIS